MAVVCVGVLLALLAGCAHQQETFDPAASPTYAEGFADGKRALVQSLQSDPVFYVSRDVLAPCDTRASWLPRTGEIADQTWWASRTRNLHTLKRCADNAQAKRHVIIRMLSTIHNQKPSR